MADAIRKNFVIVFGAAIAGVIFTFAAASMRLHTGARGPSVLQAEVPLIAVLAVLACFALALVVACVAGRLSNAVIGMFVLGTGLFVLANRAGSAEQLVFGGGSVALLALESLLWAGLIFGATVAVFRFAGPLPDIEPQPSGRHPHWLLSKEAMVSAGSGVVVLPVVWVIAQSSMKGQVLAAAICGSLVAGLVARLLSPHVQPLLLFASVCVFASVGHVLGWAMTENMDSAAIAGTLSAWIRPMPVDYAAGSMLGVAMGLGWAKSFLHHEEVS